MPRRGATGRSLAAGSFSPAAAARRRCRQSGLVHGEWHGQRTAGGDAAIDTGILGGSEYSIMVSGQIVSVLYAGPQSQYPGLDQANIPLTLNLSRRGTRS